MRNYASSLLFLVVPTLVFVHIAHSEDNRTLTRSGYFERVSNLAFQLNKIVFAVDCVTARDSAGKPVRFDPIGSGFYLRRADRLFGITCAHVIAKQDTANLRIRVLTDSGFIRVSFDVLLADTSLDVAVILPLRAISQDIKIGNISPSDTFLADSTSIIPGREIVVVGFPLGIGATYDQNQPVITTGMVAQWASGSSFLMDGSVNMGSSGSPIWSIFENKIIGMVSGYRNAPIPLYDKYQRQVAALPYNSGLANGVPAFVIKRLLYNK